MINKLFHRLRKENKFLNESIRMDIQEKAYYYYVGDRTEIFKYLEQALSKVLGSDVVADNEWIYDWVNITEKLINRRAIVYKDPAERYFLDKNGEVNKKVTDYYNSIVPVNINSKNKKAHRFAKLFNTSLTQVVFDKSTGKINYLTEPSWKYEVVTDEYDIYKPKKLSYLKEFTNSKGESEVYKVVWTDTEHYKEDASGVKTPVGDNVDMKNPYGILTTAVLRIEEGEDFWGVGAEDIVNVNEVINFLLTYLLNDAIVLGAGGIPILVNTGLAKSAEELNSTKRVRVSRAHPIVIEGARTDEVAPSVSFVSTNPLIAEIQNSIDYRIKQIAVSKGLNPNTILSEVKDTSDYQKMMDAVEQLEVRRDDIEPCRDYEYELFRITKVVNNTAYEDGELRSKFKLEKIPDDVEFMVDFAEIKLEKTVQELWQDRKERESRNMASAIDWLREENPDLTEEEAKKILENNKQINQTIGSQRQPSLLDSFRLNTEETVNE